MKGNGAKPGRGRRGKFHGAALGVLRNDLAEQEKNGDVTTADEHQLSKGSLRIDMVIRKRPGVEMKKNIYKIFRGHNVVEYKRPDDSPLSLKVFNKVVHSYAGTYAWQEDVKLTDMTATIICHKKPEELFESLEKEFNYRVLRKYRGVYYISYKGVPAEKTLAAQIIVVPELPDSEAALKALGAGEDDRELVIKALNHVDWSEDNTCMDDWFDIIFEKKLKTLNKGDQMNGMEKFFWYAEKHGNARAIKLIQKWRQEGRQEILALLENGYSLEETKKKLQLA
jgi:hypothetical protein